VDKVPLFAAGEAPRRSTSSLGVSMDVTPIVQPATVPPAPMIRYAGIFLAAHFCGVLLVGTLIRVIGISRPPWLGLWIIFPRDRSKQLVGSIADRVFVEPSRKVDDWDKLPSFCVSAPARPSTRHYAENTTSLVV